MMSFELGFMMDRYTYIYSVIASLLVLTIKNKTKKTQFHHKTIDMSIISVRYLLLTYLSCALIIIQIL